MDQAKRRKRGISEHRDFPRLDVEVRVSVSGRNGGESKTELPATISDLSLGGVRLTAPAGLPQDRPVEIIPYSGLQHSDEPLHKVLNFDIVWASHPEVDELHPKVLGDYGLAHRDSVLEVLNSWLGHLLLRRDGKDDRPLPRQTTSGRAARPTYPLTVRSHPDGRPYDLTLLDICSEGLLASSSDDSRHLPVGHQLEFDRFWRDEAPDSRTFSVSGSIVDRHDQSGSIFYKVAFDLESSLDEESLLDWAESLGGESTL